MTETTESLSFPPEVWAPKSASHPCELCTSDHLRSSFCVTCDSHLCDECWSKQVAHRPGKSGADGRLPHEKSDYEVVKGLKDILEPVINVETLQLMHRADEDTTWFGVARDDQNPVLQDYGRYTAIMTGNLSKEVGERFPQLVTFIGQTGAGKSALVKMLVDFIGNPPDKSLFPSPIVGSPNDNIPTSGDVHLYADPLTHYKKQPTLYADCEGFEGGESIPRGIRLRESEITNIQTQKADASTNTGLRQRLRNFSYRRRELKWANSPDKRKREYSVTQLYPRLLYTFSDVVVFVLRNARTFESAVLHKLLDWALKSLEKSLNQFALPHAIIVLNATDNSVNVKQWDMNEATSAFFADLDKVMDMNHEFEEYKKFWQDRGRKIESLKDLLESFYSTVTVIRMPAKPAYMRIKTQLETLHQKIVGCCQSAYNTRLSVRMLSNADDFHAYLQCAFDHFSSEMDIPFNFIEVSLRYNPIPLDFGGNILKLAIDIQDRTGWDDGKRIFQKLGHMVASCILLDIARHRSKGTFEELLKKHYMERCNYALDEFSNAYWPCKFQNNQGSCANKKVGHSKGHQNWNGKIIGSGNYKSDFSSDTFKEEWHDILKKEMVQQSLNVNTTMQKDTNVIEEKVAEDLHFELMQVFYKDLGGAGKFQSHATCLCCLRELPEHPLRCGHVLCTACIHSYSSSSEESSLAMASCPLHKEETAWEAPWSIAVMPQLAGIRVMCLDGGGIRGIVELEVLAEIEKALGGEIPIRAFFDLIVGTSSGGIIALGLGVKKWSVKTVIGKFVKLCDSAFTPREFHRIPGIRHLATVNHGSKYKSRPFEKLLKEHYEDELLFGGIHNDGGYTTKVAVVTTTDMGKQPTILSNYNRQQPEGLHYKFERHLEPKYELKTWEAARATSAAPPYFKQFVNSTGQAYLDGALYHNNPVRIATQERKLIWPNTSGLPPDILLSIGTGSNPTVKGASGGSDGSVNSMPKGPGKSPSRNSSNGSRDSPRKKWRGPYLIETLLNRIDNILDCERAWNGFLADTIQPSDLKEPYSRYQRLDLDLRSELPKLDEKDKLDQLRATVQKSLKEKKEIEKIQLVARQLVASSFYFDKDKIPVIEYDNRHFLGDIRCRFADGTEELAAIGRFLGSYNVPGFQPHFMVGAKDREAKFVERVITEKHIKNMIESRKFDLGKIDIQVMTGAETTIELLFRPEEPLPISGFPRILTDDDPFIFSHGLVQRRKTESGDELAKLRSKDDLEQSTTKLLHHVRSVSSHPDLKRRQRNKT